MDKLSLAVQLLAATQQLVEETGTTLERDEQGLYDHMEATLATNLERPVYLAAWAAGRAVSMEEVMASVFVVEK